MKGLLWAHRWALV
jgi:hypothetical protein